MSILARAKPISYAEPHGVKLGLEAHVVPGTASVREREGVVVELTEAILELQRKTVTDLPFDTDAGKPAIDPCLGAERFASTNWYSK